MRQETQSTKQEEHKPIISPTYVKVAIDLPYFLNDENCFYYSLPLELQEKVKAGMVVLVPFGNKLLNGYVVDVTSLDSIKKEASDFKIKFVSKLVHENILWDKKFLELASWLSRYYLTGIGTILAASINEEILKSRSKNKSQQIPLHPLSFKTKSIITLNTDQEKAFKIILKTVESQTFSSYLLHGITGSGKTEVYLKLIEEVIKQNKNALYLVPEIYQVPQIHEKLLERFPSQDIIIWHSMLTKHERIKYLEELQNKKKNKIMLGARSAILAPLLNIGIIIVDEAHEATYKQSGQIPRYDAVKTAVKRAEIENCPVVLGTATPNAEQYYSSLKTNTLLELPKRIYDVPMPKVCLIDLKEEFPRSNKNIISNELKKNIHEALNKKEQIILLLNRRGYASHIFCRACGFTMYCPNCSVPLVFHKNGQLLICHHCGYKKSYMDISCLCPECNGPHFKYFGLGTQQVEEEVKKIFQEAKIIRVDSDKLNKKDEYINLWKEFSSGKADILIGTQLVAKGLDIPNVTVVGVIMADTMFNFPDYLSYERAFQLLTQITGRAGRGNKIGKVFIQTYGPDNELFNFIKTHDYKSFYEIEIKNREEFQYPPFTSLIRIIFQSKGEDDCIHYANEILKELSSFSSQHESISLDLSLLGPAPCFFNKLHGKYRYHILVKIKDENLKDLLFKNIKNMKRSAKVEVIIDIDSINLL